MSLIPHLTRYMDRYPEAYNQRTRAHISGSLDEFVQWVTQFEAYLRYADKDAIHYAQQQRNKT